MHRADPTRLRPKATRAGQIRYVRWWLTEQAGRTTNLSPAALGAYLRLFTEYLRRQEPLPDDPRILAKIARVPRRAWPDIREELADVFEVIDGRITDEYADRCIAEFRATSERNRRNVSSRYPSKIEDAS